MQTRAQGRCSRRRKRWKPIGARLEVTSQITTLFPGSLERGCSNYKCTWCFHSDYFYISWYKIEYCTNLRFKCTKISNVIVNSKNLCKGSIKWNGNDTNIVRSIVRNGEIKKMYKIIVKVTGVWWRREKALALTGMQQVCCTTCYQLLWQGTGSPCYAIRQLLGTSIANTSWCWLDNGPQMPGCTPGKN